MQQGPAIARIQHALLTVAVAACLLPVAAAAGAAAVPDPLKPPQLSDAALFLLLYQEPNHFLQALGNVSAQGWRGTPWLALPLWLVLCGRAACQLASFCVYQISGFELPICHS